MSKYDELLSELQTARAEQDEMIKSLAAEGEEDDKVKAAAGDGECDDDEDEDKDEGEEFTKSLTLDNGEQCIDATDMLKSLEAKLGEQDDLLAKALPQLGSIIRAQNTVIAQQGEMIKSMSARLDALAGQGRGRKAVITLTEKTDTSALMAKSQSSQGMSQADFMLKANNAFDKKLISGVELSTIDVCLRNGSPIDDHLITKVTNA